MNERELAALIERVAGGRPARATRSLPLNGATPTALPRTTGARDRLPPELSATVRRARASARGLPIAIGFGIATPAAARRAANLADGLVVGSALVREAGAAGEAREPAVAALAGRLARACRRTKGPEAA